MRKNAWLGSLIPVLATAWTSSADATPEVVVPCSILSADERASVEARARADLAVKGLEGGVLDVACAEGTGGAPATGEVTFRWGELERSSAALLPAERRARVETLLALVDAVTTEVRAQAQAPVPAPVSPPAAAPPAPVPVSPPAAAPPAPTAVPPVAAPVPPLQSSVGARAPVPVPAPEPRAESSRPWHVGAGVEAELWATEVSGAAGLRLRGGRELAPPISVGVVVAGNLASSEPETVSVRVWRAGVELSGCSDQSLCVVLGAQLTRLVAEGPSSWSPTSHATTTFGGTLRLDYVIELGRFQLVPGAGVFAYPARRTVTLNGERVLSVPRLTGSGVLELRWVF